MKINVFIVMGLILIVFGGLVFSGAVHIVGAVDFNRHYIYFWFSFGPTYVEVLVNGEVVSSDKAWCFGDKCVRYPLDIMANADPGDIVELYLSFRTGDTAYVKVKVNKLPEYDLDPDVLSILDVKGCIPNDYTKLRMYYRAVNVFDPECNCIRDIHSDYYEVVFDKCIIDTPPTTTTTTPVPGPTTTVSPTPTYTATIISPTITTTTTGTVTTTIIITRTITTTVTTTTIEVPPYTANNLAGAIFMFTGGILSIIGVRKQKIGI